MNPAASLHSDLTTIRIYCIHLLKRKNQNHFNKDITLNKGEGAG